MKKHLYMTIDIEGYWQEIEIEATYEIEEDGFVWVAGVKLPPTAQIIVEKLARKAIRAELEDEAA